MKNVTVREAKNRLTEILRDAEGAPVVITRHGIPAGALVGFADADDYIDWQMLNDPQMRERVARAYEQFHAGQTFSHEQVVELLETSDTEAAN